MKKYTLLVAMLLATGLIAGCGGGGTNTSAASAPPASAATASVSGMVADGYLVDATVFLDKNGNYQLDAGEPFAKTDATGSYTLNIDTADVGRYPIVALATGGVTIDKDTNQPVANSYVLCMHATTVTASTAGSVSGTVSNFISPMSTLIREKLAANPSMSLTDAITQLRNQMNLPVGINMMADYVAGSQSGLNATYYQRTHTAARQMVGLMSGQAGLVMSGTGVNINRYRNMMATINTNMPAIAANVINGQGMNSATMTSMMSTMQTQLGLMPITGGFVNYSSMFRNMTSHNSFWSNTGMPMNPMGGGMMQ